MIEPMIEFININDDELWTPAWLQDEIEVTFTFRNGMEKRIEIPTATMSQAKIDTYRNKLLGKQKLVQSIFEHGTHGQITVQGLTVRADDLISMRIR